MAQVEADGSLVVTGMTGRDIGELAADSTLTVYELTPLRASLEDAFMELTQDAVEFRTAARTPSKSRSN